MRETIGFSLKICFDMISKIKHLFHLKISCRVGSRYQYDYHKNSKICLINLATISYSLNVL